VAKNLSIAFVYDFKAKRAEDLQQPNSPGTGRAGYKQVTKLQQPFVDGLFERTT